MTKRDPSVEPEGMPPDPMVEATAQADSVSAATANPEGSSSSSSPSSSNPNAGEVSDRDALESSVEWTDAELVGFYLADSSDEKSVPTGAPSAQEAFETLVDRYSRLVFKIAYSKANDREDANDICQDVFLHVHRSLPKIRDPQAFLGWLMAIAHNRANRYCRTRQSRRRRLEVAREQARVEAARRERQQQSSFEAPEETVTEAVIELAVEYQNALQWKYVEGLSYEEIGRRLDMSFHQVDYVLRKAKRALKENVERVRQQDRSGDDVSPAMIRPNHSQAAMRVATPRSLPQPSA